MTTQHRSPILATKLFAPALPSSVLRRDRLLRSFDGILLYPLTLVSAPAGFGKTTALGAWLADRDIRVAWISLDARDNEPIRFFEYLVAGLRRALPGTGLDLDDFFGGSSFPPHEVLLTPLINDLARITDDVVLVLDDYHEIKNDAVHEGILFFLEHLPPTVHVVLATRVDPAFPVSRLRVRGQLLELRSSDLRFTRDEARALFNDVLNLGLSSEQVDAIEGRTEGWIAGIQMAALSLRRRRDVDQFIEALTGADRFILEYLLEEVLASRSEVLQRALLELSILERFNASLCEHLTGVPSGGDFLALLARENLFLVPLDATGEWFRYHHLFAELLRNRLRHLHPGSVSDLYRRACEWFEEHDQISAAITHADASHDSALLAGILHRNWRYVMREWNRDGIPLTELLAGLPSGMIQGSYRLSVMMAWVTLEHRRFDEIDRLLDNAERQLEEIERDETYFEAAGQIYFIRAIMARGRIDAAQTILLGEKALALLPPQLTTPQNYQWNTSLGMLQAILANAYELSGDFNRAEELFEASLRFDREANERTSLIMAISNYGKHCAQKGKLAAADRALSEFWELDPENSFVPGMPASPYQIEARLHTERFELEEALDALKSALGARGRHTTTQLFDINRSLAQVHRLRGDAAAAHSTLDAIERLPISGPEGRLSLIAPMIRAELALEGGDLAAVESWAERYFRGEAAALLPARTFFIRTTEELLFARFLIAAARFGEAIAYLTVLIERLDRAGLFTGHADALVLAAIAYEAIGGGVTAESLVERALRVTAREGLIRSFVASRNQIAPMLLRVRTRLENDPAVGAHLGRVLGHVLPESSAVAAQTPPRRGAAPRVLVQLTTREVEILQLMARGHSNPRIAEKLYVSVNTVKTHVSHLFEKLGARSRVEALLRARELQIIE